MTSIDERVVQMKFDNAAFERGVQTTLGSLQNLKNGLKLDGATKGLDTIAAADKNIKLDGISNAVERISSKFSAMSVVAVTAISNVVNKAVNAGTQMMKSFTVDPVKAGLDEYQTNLNAIQTILANTASKGGNLKTVNAALNELNTYSDKTIYNFSEMAKNIGTFTAAGVDLKVSTSAIKGIANLAAVSGSNSEQASTAMYQLSQALAAGKVSLMDWNSVVNAGMGGEVFQKSLMDTARLHGVAIDKMVKDEHGFRNTLQKGWLTSDILTETLSKFTGDLSAKQIKAMGYTNKQTQAILKQAKIAQDAATKVKTVHQLIDTLHEASGSGWATSWQLIFGNFDEAKTLFTNVSNVLGGMISRSAKARNKVLSDWKNDGGRAAMINAIANSFKALMAFMKPIKDAFREIFPATTGKQLAGITKALESFTRGLIIGSKTANELKRTFAGVFAIFGIGWEVIKIVAKTIAHLFGSFTEGSGSILGVTARIGDFLVNLHHAVKYGTALDTVFQGLINVLLPPFKLLQKIGHAIASLFSGIGNIDTTGISKVTTRLSPLGKLGALISNAWSHLGNIVSTVWHNMEPITTKFNDFFSSIGNTIQKGFSDVNYNSVLDSVNTGLLGGLVLLLKKFLKDGFKVDVGGGMLDKAKEALEGVTGTMKTMQTQIKANILLKIAAAIALLTVSVVALSMIDSKKLTVALSAMGAMFAELMGSMALLTRFSLGKGLIQLAAVSFAMILLAFAVDTLTIAVMALSKLDWQSLAKGLVGVGVLLGILVASSALMSAAGPGMISSASSLAILALAVDLLVKSVKSLSDMSWSDLAKGLVGVGVLLGSLALFTKFSETDKAGLLSGAGLVLIALAINLLVGAVAKFAAMDWGTMARGLAGVAGGLIAMAAALMLLPPNTILSAAAIFVVAASLGMVADAVQQMSTMTWGAIAKGLVALAGALIAISIALALLPPSTLLSAASILVVAMALGQIGTALQQMGTMDWGTIGTGLAVMAGALGIIALAMFAMTGALPGAAALVVIVAALNMFVPVLTTLGGMSLKEIGLALITLAGSFAVLGLSALILAPLTPVLLALGVSIALMGIGMAAAGGGLLLFSAGLTALAVTGAAGAAAIVGIVTTLLGLIPTVMKQIGLGVIAFAKTISTAGPAIVGAIVVVLTSLMNAIIRLTPQIIRTLGVLLSGFLGFLLNYVPKLVDAGMRMVIGILQGISRNMGGLTKAAGDLIVNFLNGVSAQIPRIIDAGVRLIVSFMNGIADAIRTHSGEVASAAGNIGSAIVQGIVNGIGNGIGAVSDAAAGLAKSALHSAMGILGIHSPSKEFYKIGQYVNQGFANGLTGNKAQIIAAFNYLQTMLHDAMVSSTKDVAAAQAKLKKLTAARHKDNAAIRKARADVAQANKEHRATSAAYTELTKHLKDEEAHLGKLADKYAVYTTKIKNANQVLADATKTRDDYRKSIKDQYSAPPDITPTTKLVDYVAEEKKKIADTKKFATELQALRKLGLNDDTYKELLTKGTDAIPFIEDTLKSGKDGVNALNNLDKQLVSVSSSLGTTASRNLYQAAVDSAAGIVKGLQNQQKAIEHQMDIIAAAMVKSIKKKLGIKSPSREFAKVGGYSVDGLAKGLQESSVVAENAAAGVGRNAMKSLTKSISGLDTLVSGGMEMNPTITPVLDLSGVRKDAGALGNLLIAKPISLQGSYSLATAASAGYNSNALEQSGMSPVQHTDNLTFIQNNNSPKALSQADIYRNTKNQISVAKGALKN